MEKRMKAYFSRMLWALLIISLAGVAVLLYLQGRMESYTYEALEEGFAQIAVDGLRERVDNLVIRIDAKNTEIHNGLQQLSDQLAQALAKTTPEALPDKVEEYTGLVRQLPFGSCIQILLVNPDQQQLTLYAGGTPEELPYKAPAALEEKLSDAPVCQQISCGNMTVFLFAEKADLEQVLTDIFFEEFYSVQYDKGDYVWVDQVLNDDGGDDFARRLIYPEQPETEGSYLSTAVKDYRGNSFYQEELDGIREDGEAVFRFFSPDRSLGRNTERIAYAKLYEPLNWIIGSNVYVGGVRELAEQKQAEYQQLAGNMVRTIVIGFVANAAIVLLLVYWNGKRFGKAVDRYIQNETRLDALTGTLTRRNGEAVLNKQFDETGRERASTMILMVDVDNFKRINDTYGHDVGDVVLKRTAEAILTNIREGDCCVRWGGDEFVLLCRHVKSEYSDVIGKKLLASAQEMAFTYGADTFHISISVGGSFLRDTDRNFYDALKRADLGCYQSKQAGKNRWTQV